MTSPLLFSGPDTAGSGQAEGWGAQGPAWPAPLSAWGTGLVADGSPASPLLCLGPEFEKRHGALLGAGVSLTPSGAWVPVPRGSPCPGGPCAQAPVPALICSPLTLRNEAVAHRPSLLHSRSGAGGQDPTPSHRRPRLGKGACGLHGAQGRRTEPATHPQPRSSWPGSPGPHQTGLLHSVPFVHGPSKCRVLYKCRTWDDGSASEH